jgi:hypothetical protein
MPEKITTGTFPDEPSEIYFSRNGPRSHRRRWNNSKIHTVTNTYNMHILKSLTVIMAFIIGGYVLNATSPYFAPHLGLSPLDLLMLPIILACLTILASAGNAPILYIFRFGTESAHICASSVREDNRCALTHHHQTTRQRATFIGHSS